MIKKLYDAVLGWADKKHSLYALSTVSFLEASVFPFPPDPLLMTLCLGKPKRSFLFALFCSLFSVIGAILGYLIGLSLWEVGQDFFFSYILKKSAFEYVETLYQQNSFIAILTAAFTPIPYKVFTIAAGVFKISLFNLIIASAIGRSGRFFFEAGLIYFFGPKIKKFIDRYFNIITIIVAFIIIAIIIVYKLL